LCHRRGCSVVVISLLSLTHMTRISRFGARNLKLFSENTKRPPTTQVNGSCFAALSLLSIRHIRGWGHFCAHPAGIHPYGVGGACWRYRSEVCRGGCSVVVISLLSYMYSSRLGPLVRKNFKIFLGDTKRPPSTQVNGGLLTAGAGQ